MRKGEYTVQYHEYGSISVSCVSRLTGLAGSSLSLEAQSDATMIDLFVTASRLFPQESSHSVVTFIIEIGLRQIVNLSLGVIRYALIISYDDPTSSLST